MAARRGEARGHQGEQHEPRHRPKASGARARSTVGHRLHRRLDPAYTSRPRSRWCGSNRAWKGRTLFQEAQTTLFRCPHQELDRRVAEASADAGDRDAQGPRGRGAEECGGAAQVEIEHDGDREHDPSHLDMTRSRHRMGHVKEATELTPACSTC